MKLNKYTVEQLRQAVQNSRSIRETLKKLGVAAYGGNYAVFHKAVSEYNIDTTHFLGRRSNKGRKFQPKRPLREYLENKFDISSHKLRLRLIKEKVFESICMMCKLEQWLQRPIPLELHHIDGNIKNNSLENLQLLCPNCHAMTETYRGRNSQT